MQKTKTSLIRSVPPITCTGMTRLGVCLIFRSERYPSKGSFLEHVNGIPSADLDLDWKRRFRSSFNFSALSAKSVLREGKSGTLFALSTAEQKRPKVARLLILVTPSLSDTVLRYEWILEPSSPRLDLWCRQFIYQDTFRMEFDEGMVRLSCGIGGTSPRKCLYSYQHIEEQDLWLMQNVDCVSFYWLAVFSHMRSYASVYPEGSDCCRGFSNLHQAGSAPFDQAH